MSVRRLLMPLTLTAMAALCVEAAAQGAFPAPLPNQSSDSSSSPFPPVNQSGSGNAAPAASSPFPPVNNSAASQQRPASGSAFPSPSSSNAAASQGVFSQGSAPLGGGLAGAGPQGGGGGGGTAEQQDCMEKFAPLRQDAEKRRAGDQDRERAQGAAAGSLRSDQELRPGRGEARELCHDQADGLRHPGRNSEAVEGQSGALAADDEGRLRGGRAAAGRRAGGGALLERSARLRLGSRDPLGAQAAAAHSTRSTAMSCRADRHAASSLSP